MQTDILVKLSYNNLQGALENRIARLDNIIAILGLLGLILAIIENEIYLGDILYFEDDIDNDGFYSGYMVKLVTILRNNNNLTYASTQRHISESAFCTFLRSVIMITTVFAALLTIRRYYLDLLFHKAGCKIEATDSLWNTKLGYLMILEISFLSIHLPPKCNYIIERSEQGSYISYSADIVTTIIMMGRLYLLIRMFGNLSRWSNKEARGHLTRKNIDHQGGIFAIKAEMKMRPYTVISLLISITIFFLGMALRLCEITYMHKSALNWQPIWNGFWCILCTMTTVGYGDFYPSTAFGRTIDVIGCFWGNFLLSLMVVALTNSVKFSRNEEKAYERIKNAEVMLKISNTAADVIKHAFRAFIALKKHTLILLSNDKRSDNQEFRNNVRHISRLNAALHRKIIEFKEIKSMSSIAETSETSETQFEKLESKLYSEIKKINSQTSSYTNVCFDIHLTETFQQELDNQINTIYNIYVQITSRIKLFNNFERTGEDDVNEFQVAASYGPLIKFGAMRKRSRRKKRELAKEYLLSLTYRVLDTASQIRNNNIVQTEEFITKSMLPLFALDVGKAEKLKALERKYLIQNTLISIDEATSTLLLNEEEGLSDEEEQRKRRAMKIELRLSKYYALEKAFKPNNDEAGSSSLIINDSNLEVREEESELNEAIIIVNESVRDDTKVDVNIADIPAGHNELILNSQEDANKNFSTTTIDENENVNHTQNNDDHLRKSNDSNDDNIKENGAISNKKDRGSNDINDDDDHDDNNNNNNNNINNNNNNNALNVDSDNKSNNDKMSHNHDKNSIDKLNNNSESDYKNNISFLQSSEERNSFLVLLRNDSFLSNVEEDYRPFKSEDPSLLDLLKKQLSQDDEDTPVSSNDKTLQAGRTVSEIKDLHSLGTIGHHSFQNIASPNAHISTSPKFGNQEGLVNRILLNLELEKVSRMKTPPKAKQLKSLETKDLLYNIKHLQNESPMMQDEKQVLFQPNSLRASKNKIRAYTSPHIQSEIYSYDIYSQKGKYIHDIEPAILYFGKNDEIISPKSTNKKGLKANRQSNFLSKLNRSRTFEALSNGYHQYSHQEFAEDKKNSIGLSKSPNRIVLRKDVHNHQSENSKRPTKLTVGEILMATNSFSSNYTNTAKNIYNNGSQFSEGIHNKAGLNLNKDPNRYDSTIGPTINNIDFRKILGIYK